MCFKSTFKNFLYQLSLYILQRKYLNENEYRYKYNLQTNFMCQLVKILLFSNKAVKSYIKGLKRNLNDDIYIELNNYKQIASIASNIIFNIILFRSNTNLSIQL